MNCTTALQRYAKALGTGNGHAARLILGGLNWGFPKIGGYPFGGPNNKDYGIFGSILGSPYFGKLPNGGLGLRNTVPNWWRILNAETLASLWQEGGVSRVWASGSRDYSRGYRAQKHEPEND